MSLDGGVPSCPIRYMALPPASRPRSSPTGAVPYRQPDTYRGGGRSDRWIKAKNQQHPAFGPRAGSILVDGLGFSHFLFCLQP